LLVLSYVRNAGIATRLFAILSLLALTAACAGGASIRIMQIYSQRVTAMQHASERAILGEQVNGLINAVVMDSRGVYMARNGADVEKFGPPLLKNLKIIEDRMAQWSALVEPDSRDTFQDAMRQMRHFVALRTEIVEAGRTQGGEAADRIGNNDANRSNRQALNDAIQRLAKTNAQEIAVLVRELQAFQANAAMALPIATACGITIVLGTSVVLIVGGITRPLHRITDGIRQLAAGNLEIVVIGQERTHEIGRIAAALEVFRQQAIDNKALVDARESEREAAEQEKRGALVAMAEQIERAAADAMAQIGGRNTELTTIADELRALGERTGETARNAVSAAARALGNAQAVAGAGEELAASISSISRMVGQSTDMVQEAVGAGDETRARIDDLSGQVDRIGSVAAMIAEIASKTNLLALNATIEAARAGDAGKGFAVVAGEVKQLAGQTARCTEEITRHIKDIRTAAGAAVDAVDRIKSTIGGISDIAADIALAVEEQGKATGEIARNMSETAAAVNDINARNAEVSTSADEGSSQAARVLTMSRGMGSAVEDLKIAMIRVVRTSTAEVNRRGTERVRVDLPCRLDLPGNGAADARLTDLSLGGALITLSAGAGISATPKSTGLLRIGGMAEALPVVVADHQANTIRVTFQQDEASAAAIDALLVSQGLRRAA
jgi:methyl-accepting chemotaxis protein